MYCRTTAVTRSSSEVAGTGLPPGHQRVGYQHQHGNNIGNQGTGSQRNDGYHLLLAWRCIHAAFANCPDGGGDDQLQVGNQTGGEEYRADLRAIVVTMLTSSAEKSIQTLW